MSKKPKFTDLAPTSEANKSRLAKLHQELGDKSLESASLTLANIPRGQRGDFQRLTIMVPPAILEQLRIVSAKRKAAGEKNVDVSSLAREALTEWLDKHQGPNGIPKNEGF